MKIKSNQVKLLIMGLISAACAIAGPVWQIRINSFLPVEVRAGDSNCWYRPNTMKFTNPGGVINVEENNSVGSCGASNAKQLDLMVNGKKVTLKSYYGWTGSPGPSNDRGTFLQVYSNDQVAYLPTMASNRDRFGGDTRVDIVVWDNGEVEVLSYLVP